MRKKQMLIIAVIIATVIWGPIYLFYQSTNIRSTIVEKEIHQTVFHKSESETSTFTINRPKNKDFYKTGSKFHFGFSVGEYEIEESIPCEIISKSQTQVYAILFSRMSKELECRYYIEGKEFNVIVNAVTYDWGIGKKSIKYEEFSAYVDKHLQDFKLTLQEEEL